MRFSDRIEPRYALSVVAVIGLISSVSNEAVFSSVNHLFVSGLILTTLYSYSEQSGNAYTRTQMSAHSLLLSTVVVFASYHMTWDYSIIMQVKLHVLLVGVLGVISMLTLGDLRDIHSYYFLSITGFFMYHLTPLLEIIYLVSVVFQRESGLDLSDGVSRLVNITDSGDPSGAAQAYLLVSLPAIATTYFIPFLYRLTIEQYQVGFEGFSTKIVTEIVVWDVTYVNLTLFMIYSLLVWYRMTQRVLSNHESPRIRIFSYTLLAVASHSLYFGMWTYIGAKGRYLGVVYMYFCFSSLYWILLLRTALTRLYEPVYDYSESQLVDNDIKLLSILLLLHATMATVLTWNLDIFIPLLSPIIAFGLNTYGARAGVVGWSWATAVCIVAPPSSMINVTGPIMLFNLVGFGLWIIRHQTSILSRFEPYR